MLPITFRFIKEEYRTPDLCRLAVKVHTENLQYINDQTPELCLEAVRNDMSALEFVKEQTLEVCLAAINNNRKNMNYVLKFIKPELRQDVFITFVKDNPEILKDVLTSDQTDNIFAKA